MAKVRCSAVAFLIAMLSIARAGGQGPLPGEAQSLAEKAHALWQQDDCAGAVPLFERVTRLAPEFAESYFCLGFCYSLAHDSAKAEAALRRYVALEPRAADGWAALAIVLLDQRRMAEARTGFERALTLQPGMRKARQQLTRLLEVQHEYKAAAGHADLLLAAPGPDEEAYALSVSAYLGLGAAAKALDIAERGLRTYPRSGQLERLYVAALLDCGRDPAYRAKLVEGLEREARSATSLRTTMAVLQDAYTRGIAARRMVEQALAAYPDVPAVRCLAAQWALVNRNYAGAIATARTTAALPGADAALRAQCLVVAGLAAEQSGDVAAAETAEREAETVNRSLPAPNPGISLCLVDLLANAGRTAEALEASRASMAWSSGFAPARLRFAHLLQARNQPENAVREAEAALALGLGGDEERGAHALLAGAYFALGNESKAGIHEKWIAAHQPMRQEH